jgi:broad specificity phosphatase PhoE
VSAILLMGHASCEGLGRRLNGGLPGVRLTAQGRNEAQRLAQGPTDCGAGDILTSSRER